MTLRHAPLQVVLSVYGDHGPCEILIENGAYMASPASSTVDENHSQLCVRDGGGKLVFLLIESMQ
jgi:hypothetical protein